jgi:hypothetical protein
MMSKLTKITSFGEYFLITIFCVFCQQKDNSVPKSAHLGSRISSPKDFFVCFGSTEVWTQGLVLAKQAFYHSSHAPTLFTLVIFGIGSHVYWPRSQFSYLCFPPKWAGVCHYTQLFISWDGVSRTLWTGWPQTSILLISVSWVARTTGISCRHLTLPKDSWWGNKETQQTIHWGEQLLFLFVVIGRKSGVLEIVLL